VGAIFLFATVFLYALIGIYGRTSNASEYYVAGRRIPAMYNGMAVAADWMSAASFISMAGGLYLQGFSGSGMQPGGLVYVLGWTGGFCLVALFVAPYLRQLNLYTLPEYFAHRFGGRWPRIIAAWSAVLCSFIYVVAQIYGVGLITSRLTGVQFEIGWHACRDLDAGDAVCGCHPCVFDPGLLACLQAVGQSGGCRGLRSTAAKNR
jgi:cation/acetate symporter